MKKQFANPMQIWTNSVQLSWLIAEAQSVIAMRLLGMAGIWSVAPSENRRMVSEKAYALTKSAMEATRAGMVGAPPDAVLAAAIKPIRSKTRSNVRRLGRRGVKGY